LASKVCGRRGSVNRDARQRVLELERELELTPSGDSEVYRISRGFKFRFKFTFK